jgi:hypothetical protein
MTAQMPSMLIRALVALPFHSRTRWRRPRGAEQHRVVVQPAHAAVGLGQHEAIRHELAGDEVELTQRDRIAATPRQPENSALMVRRQG